MWEMTWAEVQAALEAGYDTALLMLGSQEQHGLHLPLSTDTLIGEALGEGVARELGKTLFAALIPVGCSSEHRGFAGLLTLQEETLASVLLDCLRSLQQQGFRRAAVLSAHGGNYNALALLEKKLSEADLDMQIYVQRPGAGFFSHSEVSAQEAGLHAGELETSLILHLRPELVRWEKAEAGYVGDPSTALNHLVYSGEPVETLSPNGVLGDPTKATPEHGAYYLQMAIAAAVAVIRQNTEVRSQKSE